MPASVARRGYGASGTRQRTVSRRRAATSIPSIWREKDQTKSEKNKDDSSKGLIDGYFAEEKQTEERDPFRRENREPTVDDRTASKAGNEDTEVAQLHFEHSQNSCL